MKNTFYSILLYTLLYSCSQSTENKISGFPASDAIKSGVLQTAISSDCEMQYDTIKNERYTMHRVILDKFYHKEKRGYVFSKNRDTINTFLYHQDIAVFANGLDSTETGIYKKLTNKVVFLILEHESAMLDYGLTQWTRNLNDLDYFMYHVSHPTCNTLSIDSVKQLIQIKMNEPHENAKKVKRLLLDNLEASR